MVFPSRPMRHGCGATRQAKGAVDAPNGSQGVAGGAFAKGVFYPITIGMALWRDRRRQSERADMLRSLEVFGGRFLSRKLAKRRNLHGAGDVSTSPDMTTRGR